MLKFKLNAHARIEIAIATVLLLGSCDAMPHKFTNADFDRLDVADVNARNAINRVDALESRVSEIEQQLKM